VNSNSKKVGAQHAAPLRLIRSARVAHLATADARGQPHVIPICFVYDGKSFYSPIDEKPKRAAPQKLKRLRNIATNPQVAIVIDHYEEDWTKLAYVLIFGKASITLRGVNHRNAVKLLRKKYVQYRTMAIDRRPLVVIRPKKVTSWAARQSFQAHPGKLGATRNP
jgi:PPOX class probable F420-dependent enzyme